MTRIKVSSATWDKDRVSLKGIRNQVFIIEQGVSERLEWDNEDAKCQHFIAYINNEAVGCARLVDNKKVGRMAVLKAYRGKSIGKEILDHIKRYASQKRYTRLELSAQCHAYMFYRNSGLTACSAPYNDAGIPHIDMELRVFSHNEVTNSQYDMDSDNHIYHAKDNIESQGYIDILLSQCNRSIILCLNDTQHPLINHEHLLSKIKLLARTNKHFKTYILINNHHVNSYGSALFKLADRLPSFIEIKTTANTIPSHCFFDSRAWIDLNGSESRFCYSDRAKVRHFMERFNKWWNHGKHIRDTRRISI
jgi:predicted GNAT family N-acyltransferase